MQMRLLQLFISGVALPQLSAGKAKSLKVEHPNWPERRFYDRKERWREKCSSQRC
jgi:hypothetical protein